MADKTETLGDRIRRHKEARYPWLRLTDQGLSEIPEEVFELTDVVTIDLSRNNLKTVPKQLWELPKLREVVVLSNPILKLPNRKGLVIDVPTYLQCRGHLDAKSFRLVITPDTDAAVVSALVSEMHEGIGPSRLTIGEFIITVDTEYQPPPAAIAMLLNSIGDFRDIEQLSIRGMSLREVPEGIRRMTRLTSLGLDGLGLTSLPDWIAELNLETLSANCNHLSGLPESFRRLIKLRTLRMGWNEFPQIPRLIYDLHGLRGLELRACNIHEVPAEILQLTDLRDVDFEDNPIDSPPAEVARHGLDAIRNYWRQRADTGVDYLCEAKVIILGEAGAGKTSLARKIKNPQYRLSERERSTEGIDVIRYDFPTTIRTREDNRDNVISRRFQANIWDFGGQEIYHATHQFFLTRRSVYVLVCDDRKEDTDFSYWLHVVEMLSDASPLLIVQNEKQDRTRDINLSGLRARFANLRGAFATNLDTNRGLDQVVRAIQKELESLPHVGVGLPATWKRVREALEKDRRDFINLDEFLDICQSLGFTQRQDKLQLSGYLHDLGICLHFQDDPLLKHIVILKPSWGTDAVYRVLDDSEVIAAHGRFSGEQLQRIWSEPKYAGMQHELLQLMMKFQLCYALDAGGGYIAPQLLSSDQPSYPWDSKNQLVVRYEYAFLPKGILTRFVVAMHRLIAGGRSVWKTGVVLEREGTRAEIIEEYSNRRIRVRVAGRDPHGLLAIVDEQLERLHATLPRLQYDRHLPCPCHECRDKIEPFGFALERLIKMAKKGHPIQCHSSGEMVDAGNLVREILPGALQADENRKSTESESTASIAAAEPRPEVFVSYAWTPESAAVVDRLQTSLEAVGIRLLRDREEVRYRDSIRDFMRRIGQGKSVVVVISEKYLKSENCMFELVEVAKAQGLRERVFPIVLADAGIYRATGRIKYVQHWEGEMAALDTALKTVRGDNLTKLQDDLNVYSEIRRLFDGIADVLRDMNALSPEQHQETGFDELIQRIKAQSVA